MNYSMVLIFVLAQSILLGNKQEESQQKQDLYCGVECLYMAMVSLDLYHQPFVKLKSSLGEVSPRGYSLESLRIEAERNGCHTLVASTEELVRAGLPKKCFAVVHEKPMHFQIVQKTNGPFVFIFDTKRGERQLTSKEFFEEYSSQCLLVSSQKIVLSSSTATFWISAVVLFFAVMVFGAWTLIRKKFALLCCSLLLIPQVGCSDEARPRIVCLKPSVDMGLHSHGSQVELRFEITNAGAGVLEISEITSSCACTIANVTKSTLPANGKAEVVATLRIERDGPSASAITVLSNDPNQSRLTLRASWSVGNDVGFSIPRIETSLDSLDDEEHLTFGITGRAAQNIMVDASSNDPSSAIHAKAQLEKHKCTATFKAIAMKPGLYTGRLRILSSERVELNSIPWSVRLLPPIELYPNRLLIEAVKSQAAEIRVSVESKLQGTLTVWSKECGAIPFDSEPHIGSVRDVKLQLPADFEDSQIYFQIEDKTAILEIERIQ